MGRTRVLLAAVGFSVLGLSSPARAEELTPEDAAARAAYERAEAAYRGGELLVALQEMEESYRLSRRDELLYNIARLEDELSRCAAARDHYEQYLEKVPQGEARATAELAIARLHDSCKEAEPAQTVAPVTLAPSAPPPVVGSPAAPQARAPEPLATDPAASHGTTQRVLGWSLVGGGVLAGAGAAYFLDSALASRSAYQKSVDRQAAGGERRDDELQVEQERHERTARVLGVSSLALLIGGAVVVLLAPSAPAQGHSAAIQLQPGAFAASYGRSF